VRRDATMKARHFTLTALIWQIDSRHTDRAGVNSDEYSADDVIEYEWVAAELKQREPEYTTVAPLKYGYAQRCAGQRGKRVTGARVIGGGWPYRPFPQDSFRVTDCLSENSQQGKASRGRPGRPKVKYLCIFKCHIFVFVYSSGMSLYVPCAACSAGRGMSTAASRWSR
jgi:hypothetical protein